MFIPTIVMATLAGVLTVLAYTKGKMGEGFSATLKLTWDIFPLLILAFIVAGMIQVLVPTKLITKWLGEEAGLKGIFMGTLIGGFCPGGPFLIFPIVAVLLKAKAGIPTMVAFLTSWSLWAVSRLVLEVGFLGWRFVIIRVISVLVFPVLAGLIAQLLVKII